MLAFAGFCLASSSVYLLNDVCDRELDRANPSKRKRPVASGLVPVSWALAASAGLLVAALGSSWLLSTLCVGADGRRTSSRTWRTRSASSTRSCSTSA